MTLNACVHCFEKKEKTVIGTISTETENHLSFFRVFLSLIQAVGKHCRHLQSIVLSQCGSLSSKGIASLTTKCRQLKMFDVAMTKVKD